MKDGATTKNFGPKVVKFFEGIKIKQIECGQFYVCTITGDNAEVYTWGDNTFKQLGYEVKAKGKSADFSSKPQ